MVICSFIWFVDFNLAYREFIPKPGAHKDGEMGVQDAVISVLCTQFLFGQIPLELLYCGMLRSACVLPTVGDKLALNSHRIIIFDRESLWLAMQYCLLYFVCPVLTVLLWGSILSGYLIGVFIFTLVLAPRAASKWDPENGRHRTKIVKITLLIGLPVSMVPSFLAPMVMGFANADVLASIYPFFITAVEFFVVAVLLSDSAVEGYSSSLLSVPCRFALALIEGSRVGLLMVTTGTSGSVSGLILATILSSILEALARNNIFGIARDVARCNEVRSFTRFERIYMSLRSEMKYWIVYTLVVMRVFDYGYTPAMLDDNSGLKPGMRPAWDVIGIISLGVILEGVLSRQLHLLMLIMKPEWAEEITWVAPPEGVWIGQQHHATVIVGISEIDGRERSATSSTKVAAEEGAQPVDGGAAGGVRLDSHVAGDDAVKKQQQHEKDYGGANLTRGKLFVHLLLWLEVGGIFSQVISGFGTLVGGDLMEEEQAA